MTDFNTYQPDVLHDPKWMVEDARFILQNDIDYVIQSVYNSSKEIDSLRNIFKQEGEKLGEKCTNPNVKFMAKIENEQALEDIAHIIKSSDAILVPRG